jgi:hypothetical protein
MTTRQDEFAQRLARASDRLCSRILHEDLEWIDVQIEIENLRDFVRSKRPEKLDLFERLYENRFRRIWDQWHDDVRTAEF